MNYIESLEKQGAKVPECYKEFRNSEDFDDYDGLVYPGLDKEAYTETTELHFDWDDYMLEELYDQDIGELIPIAILHDVEVIDDAYLAVRSNDENCEVLLCETDEETGEVEVTVLAESLEAFAESLQYPEENYVSYLENKFNTALPQCYKSFIQSEEYLPYNGELKFNDTSVFFDEFPNLQWAAEHFNQDRLEWLPIASLGEDSSEYNDAIAIKMGEDDCPVYFISEDETQQLSSSLTGFLQRT